ncbi:ankyrin repeat-containing domain protein [Trichoderma asperelloides]|nr:ankyrin repeat-containing domain protein [Trichoderma asperelloides]
MMEGDRTISGNAIGNDNVFIQGNVSYHHYVNSHAEGWQRHGENDILTRLYKSPYQDRKNRNPPRVPGTCDWFVSHEHFRTWNESKSSTMLWVSADPGCGKSVLARHLIDSIVLTTESRTVCYFFFKDDFPDQKNITSALSCILRQIFMQKPSLLSDDILKRFNTGGETFNTSFSELWKTFMQVAEDKNAGEIVCLLDAIDECEDQRGQGRSEILQALCTLYGTETRKSSNLKFLLTSRPYVEIYRSLQPGESEDEIKKISLEINTYINARVKDIGQRLQLSQGECDHLLQKLIQVPNRTYLWVYLTLDFIENSINVSKMMIAETTLNMPTTVDEAYERILSKSFSTIQARKVLHIIVAAARPLTLREMNFALALDKGRHQSYDELCLLPEDRFRESLRNICGLCVVIVDSKIYLLHQTVKEFLVKGEVIEIMESDCGDHEWKRSLEPQESHRILAEICIWHLLAGLKIYGSPTQHHWREIFLDYSAKHWASHFRQAPIKTQSMMTESILMICDVNSSFYMTWFSIYWTTTNTEFPKGFTTLMMTSYFGLNYAVSSLLTMADIDINTQDYIYQRSALSWALLISGARYKLGTFKLPFRKRAKVDSQDIYGRTPLTYAVWNGDFTLVQLLIKAEAQAHLRDELEGTPLSYAYCNKNAHIINLLAKKQRGIDIENDINRLLLSAARKGHEEVVSLLLKADRVNLEAQDLDGKTPLIMASYFGHKTIVKLLLEAGVNINARDRGGDTALMKAILKGQKAAVRLLLEAAADISVYDRNGETALTNASWFGHEAIVKLLLEAGADASLNSHWLTAKLLLEAGADINAQSCGKTALLVALQNGHEATAKLLLEAGVDINAQSNEKTALSVALQNDLEATVKLRLDINARSNGKAALLVALQNGHEATVRLLLERGADSEINRLDRVIQNCYGRSC